MERQPRKTELRAYLARHTAGAEEEALWLGGAIRLRITCYLTIEEPPSEYISSARSVVWRGSEVLTVRNPDEWHVLPGGRREGDETQEHTVHREVLEETGVHIERPTRLGFMHLHHLTPRPGDYEFLYPDVLWAVYMSQAALVEPAYARPLDGTSKKRSLEPWRRRGLWSFRPWAFLAKRARRQVHDDATQWPLEAGALDRRPDPIARVLDAGPRQAGQRQDGSPRPTCASTATR
jgi:ADP-ribose pyrophosphatase YjhB (NUDIX family)